MSNHLVANVPIRNPINNGVLLGIRAMPLKDSTSDNTSTFSIDRRNYSESSNNTTTIQALHQKKWIGGNRDASNVTTRNRVNQIGNGSLNAAKLPTSFVSNTSPNDVRQAYHRVRSGGSIVPAKYVHNYKNPPVFY